VDHGKSLSFTGSVHNLRARRGLMAMLCVVEVPYTISRHPAVTNLVIDSNCKEGRQWNDRRN
jgi:hypothetical protein